MSESTARTVIVVVVIVVLASLFFATIEIMMEHPSIPWFIYGIVTVLGGEAVIYLIYLLIKYLRKRRAKPPRE